jgi:hypothetical protein
MNKIVKYIGTFAIVGGLLAGCGTQQTSQTTQSKPKTEVAKKETPKTDTTSQDKALAEATAQRNVKTVKTADGASGYKLKDGALNITLDEVTLKEVDNPSPAELQNVSVYSNGKDLSNDHFYYVHIKYTAQNTSTDDVIFQAFPDVVVFSGQTQEEIIAQSANFITNEDDYQGTYYGQVIKHGEVGYVINMNPATADKIRIEIGGTLKDKTYDTLSDSTVVNFPLK